MREGKLTRWAHPAAALTLVVALFVGLVSAASAQPNLNQVGLVIQFKDGTIVQKCVQVSAAEVSGYEVLQNSNLAITANFDAWLGAGICKIGNDGCEADNCFCDMPNYWSYWHLDPHAEGGPAWRYSNLGASSYRVSAGAVEGWSYGQFGPPAVKPSFEAICAPPAATATTGGDAPGATPTSPPPTAPVFIPTSPPRWATAIIVGATATVPPPAAPPTQTQAPPPTAAEAPAQAPSETAGLPQAEAETPPETAPSTEEPALEAAAPSATAPAPEQPTQPLLSPASSEQADLAALAPEPATLEASFQAEFANHEPAGAAKPSASRLALVLGGLAGLGAFGGFALLLLGVLAAVILLRK